MSQLHDRLASLAVAVTVTFIFTFLRWIVPEIGHLSLPQAVGAYALNALVTVAIYKTIASSLLWSFKKNLLLRRLFLPKSFLEGTWIGYHKNDGQERFTFEFIDQSEGLTRINGHELTLDGKPTATWTSDAVSVDSQRKRLVYTYSCDVFETSCEHRGIGVFDIRRESNKYPNVLDGYAADLTNGKKDDNHEHKISDRITPANKALKEARRIFDRTQSSGVGART